MLTFPTSVGLKMVFRHKAKDIFKKNCRVFVVFPVKLDSILSEQLKTFNGGASFESSAVV